MHAMARPSEPRYSDDAFRRMLATPSVSGVIKTVPEDFLVNEQLPFEPDGEGEHLYVDLTKRGANSGWIAHQLAEHFGIDDKDIGFAGRKDRHAVTRQWFSCYLPGQQAASCEGFREDGVTINRTCRHKVKLRRGDLLQNTFEILVRHAPLSAAGKKDLEARLKTIAEQGAPNYFGPQRFGREGANLAKAHRLLGGDRQVGPRNMLISAARGWLFNGYLDRRLAQGNVAPTEMGPLIGKARDPQPGESDFDALEKNWAEGLRKLGCKVDERQLMVTPENLNVEFTADGTQITFSLIPGAFATSVLRELFLIEDASV